ncbi:MAG: response regulator, partial [Campylobacterales bacterium]
MKILIVEDELYLAQSISNKLSERGYECDFAATAKEAIAKDDPDVILLSTNISGQNFLPVIKHHKNAIIILMVNYINNDTVSIPLNEGAKDYILKPFMIEELIRKIEHFQEVERIRKENSALRIFKEHTLAKIQIPEIPPKVKLPLLLKATHQLSADAYAFNCAEACDKSLSIITAQECLSLGSSAFQDKRTIVFITGMEQLKRQEKEELLKLAQNQQAIVSTLNFQDSPDFPTVEIKSESQPYSYDDV